MDAIEHPRLCYVVTHPKSTGFLRGQLASMRARGFDVSLITSDDQELSGFEKNEQIEAIRVPMQREIRPWSDLWSFFRLYRAFRSIRPQIVNAGTPKAGLLGMLAAWATRVPVRIYTLHGLRLETTRGVKRRLLILLERLAMRCAHRVLCVSTSLRETCLQFRLAPEEKLTVLGSGSCNGLDTSQYFLPDQGAWRERCAEVRRRLNLDSNAFVLGAVGRITHDKGVADLLAVFDQVRAQYPQTQLLLVGDFEQGDLPSEACVRQIKTGHNIHWIGQVSDASSYYSAMDVLVHASSREGLPYAPLEAAAAGLPVVGYRVTGVVDAVRDGETGSLVPRGDVDAMSNAVCRYLADPSLRRQHGQAGRSRVEREFSQDSVWNNLHGEYLRLMHKRCAVRPKGSWLAKRILDISIGLTATLLLLPLLAIVATFIRWRLGSPVLFWQRRTGLHGRLFWMPKFRTMTNEFGAAGEPLPDERRLTPFGQWLRATSLDELPELWSVLRGDMSLVGPRPLLPEYLNRYTSDQARRHDVKPGITGWAQVNGRNAISWDDKFKYDNWYVENCSLATDIQILVRTVSTVLRRRGVAADSCATMPRFNPESVTAFHESIV